MKVITWNCNLNLNKKFQQIEKHKPDIAIIQECEQLDLSHFPNYKYFWVGKNDKKGLGVLVSNPSAKISKCYNDKFIYFLPIETDNINILGVWAYNHRASQKFGDLFEGRTGDALEYYQPWLSSNSKIVFSGDFNNSVIWDKGSKINNFKKINSKLEDLSFKSLYHQSNKERFGQETIGTLFHTKNKEKPYHIDYIYLKGTRLNSFHLGTYEDWISYSDHTPLIANIN